MFAKIQVQRVVHLSNMINFPTVDGSSNVKLNSMTTKVFKVSLKTF